MPIATIKQIGEASRFIADRFELKNKPQPKTALVLGSGLGHFADALKRSAMSSWISFSDIPHFRISTVEGHKGELVYGMIDDHPLLLLSGRLHFYEGFDAHDVILPIRCVKQLGIKNIILTNASGAIGDDFFPGELMVLNDHINLTGHSPLVGKNVDELGPRFVDMSEAYDRDLIALAKSAAKKAAITMHEGVYAGVLGPCYETPAEIRMFKTLGAHAVGMSTVFETMAARHMGLKVLAISCLTNKAAGLSLQKITHEEVMENNAKVADKLSLILSDVVKALG